MDRAKKPTTRELIDMAAKAAAKEVLGQQRRQQGANLYRVMERLLRAYPKRLRLMEHPEEFEFFPAGKSKDISIAPPPGIGVADKVEIAELFVEAQKRAYEREAFLLRETEYAIAPFKALPEFVVIRMYYFNENEYGQDRGADARPYSFPQITEALKNIGIDRSEKAHRGWRSKLVQEMTVMMFGADGAMSVEARDRVQAKHGSDTERQGNMHDTEETAE